MTRYYSVKYTNWKGSFTIVRTGLNSLAVLNKFIEEASEDTRILDIKFIEEAPEYDCLPVTPFLKGEY